MGSVPASEDDRLQPRHSPDLMTSCCIARKGNFRHGPQLELFGKLHGRKNSFQLSSSDDDDFLFRDPSMRGHSVYWPPDELLETRYEIEESGDEWQEARRSIDIDHAALPECGAVGVMSFGTSAEGGARSRAAARNRYKKGAAISSTAATSQLTRSEEHTS
eukprot:TRINITY_DN86548_c0_g1_i1.p1 TRINITY_DN86548_c0_g1~~TRINITY_DN86548_c0_g1_i1.p1  ORF type:complete len:161 (+),score=27.93 TRINITY_DN86548_c0_g1_i1:32-514(+)